MEGINVLTDETSEFTQYTFVAEDQKVFKIEKHLKSEPKKIVLMICCWHCGQKFNELERRWYKMDMEQTLAFNCRICNTKNN